MITDNVLYHSTFINLFGPSGFTPFELHQDVANCTRELDIVGHCPIDKAFNLPTLFPKLQVLYLRTDDIVNENEYSRRKQSLIKIPYWTSSIQAITEYNISTPLFTSIWLESAAGKLSNLSFLHIQSFDYNAFNKGIITLDKYLHRKRQFLINLRYAIALKSLTLDSVLLSFQDLDLLYQSVPKLKTLTLKYVTFLLNENAQYPYLNIPEVIKNNPVHVEHPAPNLKNLKINLYAKRNLNGQQDERIILHWIKYLALKYTNLTSFTMEYDIIMRSTTSTDKYTLYIIPLIASCIHLKTYEMMLFPISKDVLETMDQSRMKLKAIKLITTKDNMKQQLTLLSSSDQANYIERLSIQSNYEGGHIEYNHKRIFPEQLEKMDRFLFNPLLSFRQLSSLVIDCTFDRSIELAYIFDILACCKFLETLTLDHVSVCSSPDDLQHLSVDALLDSSRLKYLTISRFNVIRRSPSLLQTNLILSSLFTSNCKSLETFNLGFASIVIEPQKIDDPMADNIYLDLFKLHELRKLNVTYKLGSSIVVINKNDQCETYEFKHQKPHMKLKTQTFNYQTIVTLPQQAVTINSRLVL
ncbi:hypothetical protein INT46_000700 [Mucor plumbeus]|uniref:Uncharacterized protein n=1 Tax=Mucor plumbeus TaxID=97098 RepID=A0A8H7QQ47_9FUNG|nr:hypothetical protein INT46_000700 [Mucor plumbeus]